jgi:predicted helicase
MPDRRDALRNIHTFPQLIKFLRDELDWPIESDDFEEMTFDYTPEELGIDTANAAKIEKNGIKRLRPLSANQPWGIFFVKFEPKRLPVVALRRVLSRVVLKKRASANSAERAAWQADDLLFISNYGQSDERQISFAHFSTHEEKADFPTLMVLGWDSGDTALHLDDVADKLTTKLSWPQNNEDAEHWRERWRSAFTLRHREVITTSKALAEQMADLARSIRERVNAVLSIESDKGDLRKLYVAFKEVLIHDLSEDDFADMYAQTIAYGLLTARVSRPSGLVAENLRDMVPVTNPFLKDLLESFLAAGGRKGKVDFDELGVSEVVQLLRDADMEAVLRDFGDRNPDEDPAIHFYELFLKEYDPKKRMQRGVFYTPRPVVSYIVRSVHELLQTEFGLEAGLASTVTWGEMAQRVTGLNIPDGVALDSAFVQILDPATGTATFLVEVIDVIYRTLAAEWKQRRLTEAQQRAEWNEYVPKYLLPRLHGYELMMAPYAIAHMKIGLKLYETGYRFGSDERVRIYLTNSLEPPSDDKKQREFEEWVPALAHEAQAVNNIKRRQRFTVLIGNPPYSGESANKILWIRDLVNSKYQFIDGQKVEEKGKKNWLLDDYVKFIRLAHFVVESLPIGIIGLITNHSYLDNPTFRGMRHSLLTDFSKLFLLDLHGNYKKGETCPDGSKDENVFDIQQGVCIGLFLRSDASRRPAAKLGSTCVSDLFGLRETYKNPWLARNSCLSHRLRGIEPEAPFFFFKPTAVRDDEYQGWWPLTSIFEVYGNGIITAHDHFSIAFEDGELSERLDVYIDPKLDDSQVLERLRLRENSMWDIASARESLRASRLKNLFVDVLYRPFDVRRTFFHKSVVFNLRLPVMKHMVAGGNMALICSRMTKGESFAHAFVARSISEAILLSSKTSNNAFSFPLKLRADADDLFKDIGGRFRSNLSTTFMRLVGSRLTPVSGQSLELRARPTEDEVFNYIYAILSSPGYRGRYAESLKVDSPRLPLTRSWALFRVLAQLGGELVTLHLLESPKLDKYMTTYVGPTNSVVEKVSHASGTVWFDKAQTHGFRDVPQAVWDFHIGGYQVCEKWLKDRKGRTLSKDDIDHYQKIIVALSETIRLMDEIDKVIEAHGGWPGAFTSSKN